MNTALLILFKFFDGTSVTPPAVITPTATLGGGWNGRKDWKRLGADELKRVLSELGELPETAAKVAQIKAEHAQRPQTRRRGEPFVAQELQVDYAAIARDIEAVQWLLDAYEALRAQREQERLIQAGMYLRLLDDDEDAFMLLM